MATSGTYGFNPDYVDIVLDAWDRNKIRASAITPDHMFSARRSLNQVLVRWANKGLNLWSMEEIAAPLNAGQQIFNCPAGTVLVMEVFIRNYQLGAAYDYTPGLTTLISSTTVNVALLDHGLVADQWVSFPIPVAIGGIIVQGFYQVLSVPDTNSFNITADAATASAGPGGAVPVYDTIVGDATVTMTLANHGMLAGETWTVAVQTQVDGIFLLGDYTITSVTTNTLTFEALNVAGSSATASENDGDLQIAVQATDALPTDRIISPISRTDWAAIPSKQQTAGWPTSYWFDRQASPSLYIWPISDGTSPQELHYYRMRQIQDANPQGTETADIPYRFEEALCADLAAALAVKWNMAEYEILNKIAKETWAEAAAEDRERVTLQIVPQLESYFR